MSSVALAANVRGTNRGERFVGTEGSDYIKARSGNDRVRAYGRRRHRVRRARPRPGVGGGGDDKVTGGRGVDPDRLYGGGGDDKLRGTPATTS